MIIGSIRDSKNFLMSCHPLNEITGFEESQRFLVEIKEKFKVNKFELCFKVPWACPVYLEGQHPYILK